MAKKEGKCIFSQIPPPPGIPNYDPRGAKYGNFGVKLPIFRGEGSICEVSKSIWPKLGGEWPKKRENAFSAKLPPPLEFQIMTPGAKYGDFGVKLPIFEGEKSIYEVSKAIETKLRHFIMGGPKMAVFRIFFRFLAITPRRHTNTNIFFDGYVHNPSLGL